MITNRPALRCLAVTAAATAALVTTASPAAAHEKWFIDSPESYPTDWSFLWRPVTLSLVVVAVVVAVCCSYAARLLPTPELRALRFLGALVPYVPRLLAIYLGVSLVAAAFDGHFLTRDLAVEGLDGGAALLLAEGVLGAWFITGIRLRPAALTLLLIGPCTLLLTGPVGLLSALYLMGVAAFLAFLPPSDARFGRVELDEGTLRRALLGLRLGVGGALITLAFAEKLANPALARETLRLYPQLDVFALVGIDLPTDTYVAIVGATELLFGLLVISGRMPQLAVLVASIPFNATLLVFGVPELLGHLPVYGFFLALLVYGSHPGTAPLTRWLPWPRQPAIGVAAPAPTPSR